MSVVPERPLSYGEILERDRKVKQTLSNVKSSKRWEKQLAKQQSHKAKRAYKKIGKNMQKKVGLATRDYYDTIDRLRNLR